MPNQKTVHYNPPADNGKTRCGLNLSKVTWRTDSKDVTCNRCQILIRLDSR